MSDSDFIIITHGGVKLPVWRSSGLVPLSSSKVTLASGVRPGEVCGLKPEKALPFIAAGTADIYSRALEETGLTASKIADAAKPDPKAEDLPLDDEPKVVAKNDEKKGAVPRSRS